ncbi:MAG TPA: hypothetical protein VGM62_04045, partial [Chthoniobacterales bacterium]
MHRCARNAFHILAAHREAVAHLSLLRRTTEGISVLSYYSFSPERIEAIARRDFPVRRGRPLKIFAAGNLEGRKGVAGTTRSCAGKTERRQVQLPNHQ